MLVAETALYVAIACGERRKIEDRYICFTSLAHTITLRGHVRDVAYLHPARTIEQIIRDSVSSIPGVHGVQIEQDGDETLVRIAVNDPPRDLRYEIYDKQSVLAQMFPEMLFDFSLAYAG